MGNVTPEGHRYGFIVGRDTYVSRDMERSWGGGGVGRGARQ